MFKNAPVTCTFIVVFEDIVFFVFGFVILVTCSFDVK